MEMIDFLNQINSEIRGILSEDFAIEVSETTSVPRFDDSLITYDNLDEKNKRCKILETCVLYIDIRNSARMSVSEDPAKLARLYSSFVRSMIAAARYFGGHIRNIIGDRVMVVFDREDCFKNAINTAVLMNTISSYIINENVDSIDFRCGIGIDFGKMLVVKAGAIRRGAETEFYRSLVWLGRPANIASRLTDIANKTISVDGPVVSIGLYFPTIKDWAWLDRTQEEFIDELETTGTRTLRHKEQYFATFIKSQFTSLDRSFSPILFTEDVLLGLEEEYSEDISVREHFWRLQEPAISEHKGRIYGGDVIFTAVSSLT